MPFGTRLWIAGAILLAAFGYHSYLQAHTFHPNDPKARSKFLVSYDPMAVFSEFGTACAWASGGGSSAGWNQARQRKDWDIWFGGQQSRFEQLSLALVAHVKSALSAEGESFEVQADRGKYVIRYSDRNHQGTVTLHRPEHWPVDHCQGQPTSYVRIDVDETAYKK
jgi:hypothetical protein